MKKNWVSYKDIPNIISLIRILLVLPFVVNIYSIYVLGYDKNWLLMALFFTIILSDILDGFLARRLNCTSDLGEKLDIISDSLYTISSLMIFFYLNIIPVWFVIIVVIKLLEFVITSKIINTRKKTKNITVVDKIGKLSIMMVMLLPGVFVFRCIVIDYKIVMNIFIYIITIMFIFSSIYRIKKVIV